jgi:DNA-binding transcriptional LysR family regulator
MATWLLSMAVFKRTVDVGSFAAAARHFRISPEMAGNHVRALEAHLGVRLLNRSSRRLHLTEAGSGNYARCKQILADIEEAEAQANLLQATPRGLLRVAAPVTFGVLHIAPAAGDYMTRYPEVTFDVAISDRFVDLIDEGFDLAIRIGDLQDSNLIVRRLASARLITCASPTYLRRAGTPQTPTELSRHACLIYSGAGGAPRPGVSRRRTDPSRRCASPGRSPPPTQPSFTGWRSLGMASSEVQALRSAQTSTKAA